jgi:DNA polymerase family B, exonuclease domain
MQDLLATTCICRTSRQYQFLISGAFAVAHQSITQDKVVKAEPKVLAYDIECTKAPLKFPTVEMDQVTKYSKILLCYACNGVTLIATSVICMRVLC